MLAMYVSKNQDDWDDHLPKVLMAYRTSKHDTTKCSPYYLLLERKLGYHLIHSKLKKGRRS